MLVLYTDGSAKGNGKEDCKGGYGVVVYQDDKIIDATQEFSVGTTNNREEIKGILWALENYGGEDHREHGFLIPRVYTDSMYCVRSFTDWLPMWKRNDWTRANGESLENLDLIQRYDELLSQGHMIDLVYTRGHVGTSGNEIADLLATGMTTVEAVLAEGG